MADHAELARRADHFAPAGGGHDGQIRRAASHRASGGLLNILARALPERFIRTAARCVAVVPDGASAVARFADGSEIESDIVIGADGIHSAVRGSLFGPEAPRFTGCVCYRGLVPAADVPSSVNSKDMTLWMGPHGHIVHYPVRRGEFLNVVAHYDSDAWTEESWTRKCEQSEVAATYSRWHESLQHLIESNPNWYKWALYDREPLERWSVGRATLLGDSAHAMLPISDKAPRWPSRTAACLRRA